MLNGRPIGRAGAPGQHSNLQTDHQIDAFACRDLGMTAEELRRDWYDPNELDLTGEEIALLLG